MAELYNEGLLRKGLVRTSGLVRPDLLLTFDDIFSPYAIDRLEAALALDFDSNVYRTGNKDTTFAEAFMGNSPKLTYNPGSASSSQSTMTQGYGPELVTNGGFDTDTDWDTGTGWTISDGQLTASSATGVVYQIVSLTGGKSYHITASNTANIQVRIVGGTGQSLGYFSGTNVDKIFTFISGAGTRLEIVANGTTSGSIDNVSVREAPKIVWAPHNLLDYSDDFSQWSATSGATVGSPTLPDPTGGNSASQIALNATTDFVQFEVSGLSTTAETHFRAWVRGAGSVRVGNVDAGSYDTITLTSEWRPVDVTQTPSAATRFPRFLAPIDSGVTFEVFGAHLYRSDLGGMAPVPGAEGDFQYYVPTNGNAEYLPRVGHHVYNGSAWVNEGLLIESEPRTNLVTDSSDFHAGAGWLKSNLSTAADQITSPSGQKDADELIEASGTITASIYQAVAAGTHTVSCYMKANSAGRYGKLRMSGNIAEAAFDLTNGTVAGTPYAPDNYGIEDVGNGWYLCWISATAGVGYNAITGLTDNTTGSNYTGDGTSSIYVWGMQVEQGSTPSSYIPTNGSTVIRGAQSLTVPANWYDADNPTPTGPELVTNGGFDADTSGWTGNNATLSLSSGRLRVTDNGASSYAYQVLTVEPGKTYKLTFDYLFPSANTSTDYEVNIRNTNQSGSILKGLNTGTTTWVEDVLSSNSLVFTPNTSTVGLTLASSSTTGDYADFDNISVRQVSAPQFGWPEPEFIGPNLVDNSGFDTDTSSWTALNSATLTNPAGNLDVENSAALTGYAYQAVTTKIGSVYKYSVDLTHSGDDGFIRVGTGSTVWDIY